MSGEIMVCSNQSQSFPHPKIKHTTACQSPPYPPPYPVPFWWTSLTFLAARMASRARSSTVSESDMSRGMNLSITPSSSMVYGGAWREGTESAGLHHFNYGHANTLHLIWRARPHAMSSSGPTRQLQIKTSGDEPTLAQESGPSTTRLRTPSSLARSKMKRLPGRAGGIRGECHA